MFVIDNKHNELQIQNVINSPQHTYYVFHGIYNFT